MGTLIRKTFVNSGPGSSKIPMSCFNIFFSTLNCPLITSQSLSSDILTLGIDDTIQLILNGNSRYEIYIIDDTGTEVTGGTFNTFRDYFNFTIYYTDTFFYLYFKDPYGDKFFLVYEKISGKRYFGTTWDAATIPWLSITALTFKQVENQSNYKYSQLLNYSCGLDNIDYSSNILFNSNNEVTDIIDSNTLTCSTVSTDTILTFNGKNYYSIGANTLVEVDL